VSAAGRLEFYGITDRGPNGDGPTAPTAADPAKNGFSKVFPAPSFTPSIGLISVSLAGAAAELESLMPVTANGVNISGLPINSGVGATGETPLTEALRYEPAQVDFDGNGLDPEGLVYDARNKNFWISDEYGPFLVKIDAANGKILKKYTPGAGAGDLPAMLIHRRANRGMEGLAQDQAGRLHGFLQSPVDPQVNGKSRETVDYYDLDQDGKTSDKVKLKDYAQFVRWIEFNPATETSTLYAYPIDGSKYDKNRPGNAKLGDLVSVARGRGVIPGPGNRDHGNKKFLVIEQGKGTDGVVHNYLMLVEIPADATPLTNMGVELEANSIDNATASNLSWSGVITLKKKMLLDLNAEGWQSEKAEGLTLVNAHTVALINDNDFGLRTMLTDVHGETVEGSIEDCTVDINGDIINDGKCPAGAVGARITQGIATEQPTHLWLIRFPQPLASYGVQ
jgi:hypothetical protein